MREVQMIADLLAKPEPSAETVDAGRRRLRRKGTSRRPRRGMLFGGLGGFVTLVAGVAAAAVLMAGGGEQVLVKPDNAASALQTAAERAESTSWGSGEYWYVKSHSTVARDRDSPPDRFMSGTLEVWMTRDGQTWHKPASPPGKLVKVRGKSGFFLCGKEVGYREIQNLPTEPGELHAELRQMIPDDDGGPLPPELQGYRLHSCMISLLGEQPAPPEVRAAIFRSLAGLPETRELGTGEDRDGRKGTVLTITSGENLHELIIDPTTSAVLQKESFEVRGGQTLLQIRTFYETGWTDVAPS